jgi:hypothetical protein
MRACFVRGLGILTLMGAILEGYIAIRLLARK